MTSETPDRENDIIATDTPDAKTTPDRPRIVGIAASAGGLEALSPLVQNLPLKANAVYVIAQHMSPTHKSVLSTLIARETPLAVHELHVDTKPEPDSIYVTPPNTDVVFEGGMLRLKSPSGLVSSPKPSADRLFKSLALECRESCTAIVLSGTGTDGSYGVQAVREAGGVTIAQDPATAKYDAMPVSAIQTGCIDLTLSPDQIGAHLRKILAHPRDLSDLHALQDHLTPLGELFGILMARTQVDFGDYRENTVNRRIARRMTALGIESYDNYVDYCRTNVDEVDALHRYLLISVTEFFRDPDQFEQLNRELRHRMVNRGTGPIRVWVVGCATGEEAYSIAITIAEILGGIDELAKNEVQIFATDIDQNAIEVARSGTYPLEAVQDIPAALIGQYFIVGDADLTVRPELRAATLFSHHNVFQDPPFVNIDLISIRNLLIYFNRALQERVLSRLHYAMAAGGLMFLGTSETVGELDAFFEPRPDADKIFTKRRGLAGDPDAGRGARGYRRPQARKSGASGRLTGADSDGSSPLDLADVVAPNGMICTRSGHIVEVLGDLSPFMEIRAGASTALNIKMLIEPLRNEISSLIAVALRNRARREGRWHTVALSVGNRVQMQVYPFSGDQGGELQCLVSITARTEQDTGSDTDDTYDAEKRAYVERIESEINSTQEALQQTIGELQIANEDLQSVNEELRSTNEKFEATNEELLTSNEELQSSNEELLMVNEELQISSTERQSLASDLEATMASAPYAVALADQALMIRRMSREAMTMFGLSEIPPSGIHLSQCTLPVGFPAFAPLANTVLRVQETRRIPLLSEGRYFTLVMSPVHDAHHKLIGLSITITQFDSEPLSRVVQMMSDISRVAHWSYNLESRELFWSPEMFAIYGRPDSGDMPTWDDAISLIHPEDRQRAMDDLESLKQAGGSIQYEHRIFGPSGHLVPICGKTTLIRNAEGDSAQLIGVMWNSHDEAERDARLASLETLQEELGIGFFWFDVENNAPQWNRAMYDLLGYNCITHTPSVESMLRALHPDARRLAAGKFQKALENGEAFSMEFNVLLSDGTEVLCECIGHARRKCDGKVTHVYGSLRRLSSQPAKVSAEEPSRSMQV
jgi:two-component system, chemotaxis family, CheB/CheR fusion protein